MLNFTMHAAGNELIFFYSYHGTIPPSSYRYRGITVIFLPLPREYRINFPIYHGNTPLYYRFPHYLVTLVDSSDLIFVSVVYLSLTVWKHCWYWSFVIDIAVTHNCIIATVQLFHPTGQEAKNRLPLCTYCCLQCCSWMLWTVFCCRKRLL